MPIIEIKHWNGKVLHTIETDSIKLAVEALVKQGADLQGAYLRGADLRGVKIGDLTCLSELSDAIDLAPMIFEEWNKNGFDAAKARFGLYQISGEEKALIAMCPLLVGGFCFVLHRREIWWWSWSCPDPETVPVLWRDSDAP